MLTGNDRIKDVYAHPVGRDILRKILLQMGHSDKIIKNPVVGSIKLKALPRLTGGQVDAGFLSTLLELLNSEPGTPRTR
jgi:hypothetical protein